MQIWYWVQNNIINQFVNSVIIWDTTICCAGIGGSTEVIKPYLCLREFDFKLGENTQILKLKKKNSIRILNVLLEAQGLQGIQRRGHGYGEGMGLHEDSGICTWLWGVSRSLLQNSRQVR